MDALTAGRAQFALTIMFHYLFPALTMGLGLLIVILKTLHLRRKSPQYGAAARFWARIFAITFAAGVVTGIPMEFQFGTNWSEFSRFSGGVVGHTLFMEGLFAFFAESSFLGLFLFGEKRLSPNAHWFAAFMVAFGAIVSGFFIIATDAWMQNPMPGSYRLEMVDGIQRAQLVSLWALVSNPYAIWQFLHTIIASFSTASFVMAGVGAYYLLSHKHEEFGRLNLRVGVKTGLVFAVLTLLPTGSLNAENVARYQKPKLAAMEGIFETQAGAPLSIVGVPDMQARELKFAIKIPKMLSLLAYRDPNSVVTGLNDVPPDQHPPVQLVFQAYHIMIGLGMTFIGVMALAAFLLWRGMLYTFRPMLWLLIVCIPLPYIATEMGWVVAEVGRQPWVVWELMRTAEGVSGNVSSGATTFTLFGFAALYLVLFALYLFLIFRTISGGLGLVAETPVVNTEGHR